MADTYVLDWRQGENWPFIGNRRLVTFTHDCAFAADGTRFVRVGGGTGEPTHWQVIEEDPRATLDEPPRHPDAYPYGEPWGPDNPAPGSAWDNRTEGAR